MAEIKRVVLVSRKWEEGVVVVVRFGGFRCWEMGQCILVSSLV